MAHNTTTPAIFGLPGARVVPPQDVGLTYKTNQLVWLRGGKEVYSDNGTTLAVNDDLVYLWKDQSGNGNNFAHATSGNRPTYKTGIIGAQPVLRFDGSSDYLKCVNDISSTNPDIVSFFLVVIPNDTSPVGIFDTNNFDGTPRPIRNYDGGKWDVYGDAPSELMALANTNKVLLEYVHTCDINMKKTLSFYKNGTFVHTNETGDGAIASEWSYPVIGAINEGYTYYTGDIAELIIYNEAISSANRALVELYLRNKFGLW
jgi:hypothetical protein